MKRIAFAVMGALALAGCATEAAAPQAKGLAQYADDPRLGEETKRICFASNIDGFSLNERSTVVLSEGRDDYMVEVTGSCFDLDNAETIALDSPTGCLTPGDAIIVASTMGGGGIGPQRCLIREIRKWDPKAEKPAEKPTGS